MANEKIENITAGFSKLSDTNCALFLENFLLEALESETYFELELIKKLMNLPETSRESLTKILNNAIKRNRQKITEVNISDWIKRYLNKYASVERKPDTFLEFCLSDPAIRKLDSRNQIKLMRIYRIYDYLLVEPIVDLEYPIDNIFRFPMYLSQSPEEIRIEMSLGRIETATSPGATASEKLAVKDALRKFPKLGEQAVTASPIKLKQFDQPVRPSVRNWLYDYTSQLGQTGHSSMDRTTYLFRSENAKNLSSPEREKLAIILKSFDENMPLPIDGARQEIVFERPSAPPKVRLFPSAPTQRRDEIPQSRTLRDSEPIQKQASSFVRPYPQPEIPKTTKFDQGSTFPLSRLNRDNSSRSNLMGVPQGQTFEDAPTKIYEDKIEYTNPYPRPGTHETQFEKSNENISNIRFSEGAPKDSFTPISQVSARKMPAAGSSSPPVVPARSLAPVQKSAPVPPSSVKPAAYRFTPPDKNMIYPHGGEARRDKPEPRIDGNIVDLKGEK